MQMMNEGLNYIIYWFVNENLTYFMCNTWFVMLIHQKL